MNYETNVTALVRERFGLDFLTRLGMIWTMEMESDFFRLLVERALDGIDIADNSMAFLLQKCEERSVRVVLNCIEQTVDHYGDNLTVENFEWFLCIN